MKPGRHENLLCSCLFQDIVRIGWFWVCFEWVFCLFVLSWVFFVAFVSFHSCSAWAVLADR